MAVIKHIAIKNSSYTAAVQYLSYKHDEYTNKPILDEFGNMILRDSFLLEGINCSPMTYGMECSRTNDHFGKNKDRSEIKAHHYIISFDPRDRDENGLTAEHAQELGLAFAKKNFPGHQVLVCTHPDGHNSAGNIHVHIVLNSVRAFDVPQENFMERPGDALAGHKHHVTKNFLEYLKQETMEMCQHEQLNQVDLMSPAKVRITDREYWAQRRGQKKIDDAFVPSPDAPDQKPPRYETQKMILRRSITETAKDSSSFEEFEKKLFENYGIALHESRGAISYILPDRNKPIRGRSLGTDFEKAALMHFFIEKEKQNTISQPKISKGQKVLSSDRKSIGLITDLDTCIKAQQSPAYARAVKIGNLQQMAQTRNFLAEHGIDSLEELNQICFSTKADYHQKLDTLKETEADLKQTNMLIHATGQYLSTKAVHSEYLKAKNKKKFREEHSSELAIYDAALKELREYYGDKKFMTMKMLKERKSTLTARKNAQYEDFCFARSKHRQIQNVARNVRSMLDLKAEIEQEKGDVQRQDSQDNPNKKDETKYRN